MLVKGGTGLHWFMWYCTVFVGCQVNLTSKIIFHCNLIQNTIIIIHQNAVPSVVSWSLAVLIRLVYVKMLWWFVNPLNDILQQIGFLQIIIILNILIGLKVHSTVYLANLWYSTQTFSNVCGWWNCLCDCSFGPRRICHPEGSKPIRWNSSLWELWIQMEYRLKIAKYLWKAVMKFSLNLWVSFQESC